MWHIVTYLIAAVGIPILYAACIIPLGFGAILLKRMPGLAGYYGTAAGFLAACGSIWLFRVIAEHTPLVIARAEVFVPMLMGFFNDVRRRNKVNADLTYPLPRDGRVQKDKETVERMESGFVFGGVVGYAFSLFVILEKHPWF